MSSSREMQAQPQAVMRQLWAWMAEVYGPRWTSAFGVDASVGAGPTWARGLAGLMPAQVANGMGALLTTADGWPPSLPEFRALCFGIPSLAAVRIDLADKDTPPSPFARLVWARLDGYRWRTADSRESDRMLRDAYDLAREHVLRGGALPAPPAGEIAHTPAPRVPASRETAQAHISELAAMLGGASLAPMGPAPGETRLEAH